MAVLAAMRERKPRGVLETIRRAMHHFGHHRQRLYGARADTRRQQQFLEVHRAPFGGRRQRAVEPAREYVARPHLMTPRHDEMRQVRLRRRQLRQGREFPDDAVRPQRRQQIELG